MNLYIGNLSAETTEQDLRNIFAEFGQILVAKIIIDPQTGLSKGFGFVEFDDKFESYEAMDALDMTHFMGNIITVKEAKGNKTAPNKGGRKPFNKKPSGNAYPRKEYTYKRRDDSPRSDTGERNFNRIDNKKEDYNKLDFNADEKFNRINLDDL